MSEQLHSALMATPGLLMTDKQQLQSTHSSAAEPQIRGVNLMLGAKSCILSVVLGVAREPD